MSTLSLSDGIATGKKSTDMRNTVLRQHTKNYIKYENRERNIKRDRFWLTHSMATLPYGP